jgi:hypothetical protein
LAAGIIIVSGLYLWPQESQLPGRHFAPHGERSFYSEPSTARVIEGPVVGGIVSHHLLVTPELANFYAQLREERPERVILLGPDHFDLGQTNLTVSRLAYETPWGELEPDLAVVDDMIDAGVVTNYERPFELEHSISAEVAYLKKTFPRAKLVPIIIKRGISRAELDNLVRRLESLPDKSLVLASVDFSHHQTSVIAQEHDQISIETIKNFDFGKLFQLDVDSPGSLYVLLKYLDNRNARQFEYWNTNSAIFTNQPDLDDVTSYVFAYFTVGKD